MTEKQVQLSDYINTDATTFREMWDFYLDRVMPKEAGDIQRSETRRAFYLGAMLLRIVLENCPDDPASELAYCNALENEFDAFMLTDLAELAASEGTVQ